MNTVEYWMNCRKLTCKSYLGLKVHLFLTYLFLVNIIDNNNNNYIKKSTKEFVSDYGRWIGEDFESPKEINLTNLTGNKITMNLVVCEPKYNKIIKETSISRKVDKLSKLNFHDIPVYCYHRLFKHIFDKIPNILFKDIGETPLIMAVNECNLNLVKMKQTQI